MADHADQTSLAAATAAIITARWPSSGPTGSGGHRPASAPANGYPDGNGYESANGYPNGSGHNPANGYPNGNGHAAGNGQSNGGGHSSGDYPAYPEWAPSAPAPDWAPPAPAADWAPPAPPADWAPPAPGNWDHQAPAEWAPPTAAAAPPAGPGDHRSPVSPRAAAATSFFAAAEPEPVPEIFDGRVPSQRGPESGGFAAFAPAAFSPAVPQFPPPSYGPAATPPHAPTSPAMPTSAVPASAIPASAVPTSPAPWETPAAPWEQPARPDLTEPSGRHGGPRSGLPSRDAGRTQVPPGFERRNFGTFADDPAEPAPGVTGYGLDGRGGDRGHDIPPHGVESPAWGTDGRHDTPPRGFETVAPAALLGTLPPAVPANPMPTSFAPPAPAPWGDSGWIGWDGAGSPDGEAQRDHERAFVGGIPPSGATAPRGASLAGHAKPVLPRRVPQVPDVPDFAMFDSDPAPDLLAERSELSRIATYLRDDDDAASSGPRPDGVDLGTVLDAVLAVAGLQDAQLRWNAGAGQTMRIEFTDGADESEVTRRVVRLLRERMGLAAEPATEESSVDSPYRGRAAVGATRPSGRSGGTAAPALPRPAGAEAVRLVIENVTVTRLGAEASVAVRLRLPGGATVVGEGRGPGVDAYLSRLAATAAANAADQVLVNRGAPRGKVFVEHVSVVPFGVVEVAVVVLVLSYDGRNEQLSGSAVVGSDPQEAVARATLGALNRRLESLLAA